MINNKIKIIEFANILLLIIPYKGMLYFTVFQCVFSLFTDSTTSSTIDLLAKRLVYVE